IERSVLELKERFKLKVVVFDPYQMQSTAQRLRERKIRIEEYQQTPGNLTDASQNLYELIKSRRITLYPDAPMRLACQRAVAKETARGWGIAKEKSSHKIDVIVALAMACRATLDARIFHISRAGQGPLNWDAPDWVIDLYKERARRKENERHPPNVANPQ